MKKILVPTDGSDLSGYALSLAQKFAKSNHAEIYALKVIPTPADAVFDREGTLLDAEDFNLDLVKKKQKSGMEEVIAWLDKMQIPAVPVVKAGNLTDQILHFTQREKIDLVVMGTHGLTGMRELIADSVTEQVVRQSSVPVLSLKCDRSDLEIKNIVLASSFEADLSKPIYFLRELQQAFGATIHLLRVNTSHQFKTTRYLQERMRKFAEVNGLTDVAYHIYNDKEVETGIVHFAEDAGMDMISIGVEKDSISKLFQKHVSSALVNHVFYPVLTFKI